MPTKRTGNPRGRPPGAKNKPKTVQDFVVEATLKRPAPPPRPEKMKPRGPWANLDAEGRAALSAKLIAARKGTPRKPRPPEVAGRPAHLTDAQFLQMKADVQPEIKRIIKKMKAAGQLPEDPRAEQVLTKTLETFLTSTTARDVASLGRLILDFTKTKPAAKMDVTVRTHEDFLDELAGDAASE